MKEEIKKRNKIMGISIGILVVLLVVISSTYAYWQITKAQDDANVLKAACLDLNVEFGESLSLQSEWPIDDSEALKDLTGYKFTVTNNCPYATNYVVGLESVEDAKITKYMSYASVALAIDNNPLGTYDLLPNLTGPTANARASKELMTGEIGKGETKTHQLKLWIDKNASVDDQSKGFVGKVFLIGGQGIENDNELVASTPESCFGFDEATGEITSYKEECGTSVVIPNSIKDKAVKVIDTNAFRTVGETEITNYNVSMESVVETETFDESSANMIYVIRNQIKGQAIDFSKIMENMEYAVILTDDPDINATYQGYQQQTGLSLHTEATMPDLAANLFALYLQVDASAQIHEIVGGKYAEASSGRIIINSLDLSQAYNLEKIEPRSFSNYDVGIESMSEFVNQQTTKPVSLTSLKFGKTTQALEIGWAAFDGIDVDNLTVYSNMYAMDIGQEGENIANHTIGYFAGSKIDTLNVEYVNGYPKVGDGILYSYINANQVNIGEGITEIPYGTFGSKDNSNCFIQNVSLPSTISEIGQWAFIETKNINFVAGHCNGVKIDSLAWHENSVVTPSICVLGQNIN